MDSVNWNAVRRADPKIVATAIKLRGQHNIIAEKIQEFLNGVVELHKSLDLEWLRNIPPDLAKYPILDSIQKYLWHRLCTLDQKKLYELHYQMITFGKVFCTKRNPNCNTCPMRTERKHFASAFASSRLALPGPSDKMDSAVRQAPTAIFNPLPLASPSEEDDDEIEYDSEGIPIIKLNLENLKTNLCSFNGDYSKALVALNSYAASIPRPKLKNVSRLRTEHQVNGRRVSTGTYFQTNEVFADYETSKLPLNVPRKWIGNLRTKTAYFGTSISAITRGLSMDEIQKCFWNGIVCVRGFERCIKAPRPLGNRFHCKLYKMGPSKEKSTKDKGMPKTGRKGSAKKP
ncbi:DNA glycosylase [Corchorus capsularis]|uniref:DNA glycosylase n=1 Tax=Corchorus capsularis TaxID=210143 RepID=A0A1R3JAJ7_COCAP|nr:DNA glycosylase [Corchorus capsularis]